MDPKAPPALPPHGPLQFWLRVELDDPAGQVFLDGRPTKSAGPVRDYVSPDLPPGKHEYLVEARWGDTVAWARVTFKPGEAVRLQLRRRGPVQAVTFRMVKVFP